VRRFLRLKVINLKLVAESGVCCKCAARALGAGKALRLAAASRGTAKASIVILGIE
jgi:hypothetical protein